jgi:hypothetical protein
MHGSGMPSMVRARNLEWAGGQLQAEGGSVTIDTQAKPTRPGSSKTLRADGISAIVRLVPCAPGPLRVPCATCTHAATEAAPLPCSMPS